MVSVLRGVDRIADWQRALFDSAELRSDEVNVGFSAMQDIGILAE